MSSQISVTSDTTMSIKKRGCISLERIYLLLFWCRSILLNWKRICPFTNCFSCKKKVFSRGYNYKNTSSICQPPEQICSVSSVDEVATGKLKSVPPVSSNVNFVMSRTHVYITAHFFSTAGAFPSAFSISRMIRLKTSTAVCTEITSLMTRKASGIKSVDGSVSWKVRSSSPRSPWLKTPWMQPPRSQPASFLPLA